MCTKTALQSIAGQIVAEARRLLGDKLDKVILYGSYARGDFDDESDIDIMVLAHISKEEAKRCDALLFDFVHELNWKYNVLISLYVNDCDTFYHWLDDLPFYQSVMRDGVLLSA